MSRSVSATVARAASGGTHSAHDVLEISLFGTLRAYQNGREIALRLPHQALRLFAFLLLHRNRVYTREHVAFTLWPDDDEADARANVRRKLHLLGRALPPAGAPWFLTTATTIGWNQTAPFRLDIAEFERLCAHEATRVDADALYSGDLLAELYDDWAERERERLRTMAIDNLLTLLAGAREQRDYAGAIRWMQRVRGLDPWREDVVRTAIALRHEAGDRAGALAEFERFRTALGKELAVDPMPETVCVYERVLAFVDAPAANTTLPALPAPARPRGIPFVDRRRERDRLERTWSSIAGGHGGAMLIVGEGGIGKSRLIDEFARSVEANGGRVLRGGTAPFEIAPYQAVSEALRSALPIVRSAAIDALWLAVLATLVPSIRTASPSLPDVPGLSAEAERSRLFRAVEIALGAVAATRATVVVLEDLHWAGAATIALVEHIARCAASHRLLLVASCRDDELPRTHPLRALRRRLERERLLEVTPLGRLDAAAVGAIVDAFVDEGPAEHARITDYLLEASDGNPLYLSEVLANDREAGLLDESARRWRQREIPANLPFSIAATLTERVTRLSGSARSLLEIGAVVGTSFSVELVREVGGLDERSTIDALGELIDRRLVREADGGANDFCFSHQLCARTVYTGMSTDVRTRRHRRIGQVIEDIYADHIEQFAADLATHYARGNEPERAAEYYRLAARQALGLYAYDEATTLATRGLELTSESLTRFALIEIREEAAHRLGDRGAQRAASIELDALARESGRPDMLREALRRRAVLAHDCAERTFERAILDELEPLATGAPPPWPAAYAALEGSYLSSTGAYAAARSALERALQSIVAADYPRIYVECRSALVELAGFEGRVADVRSFLADVPTFERDYAGARLTTLLETACAAASKIQDYRALANCAERLLRCAHAVGYREGEAAAYKFAGRAALCMFDLDRARGYLEQAVMMFEAMGQRLKQFHALVDIANLATTIGRFDEAMQRFATADTLASEISYGFGNVVCANNISCAAYLKGDFDAAFVAAQRALECAERIGVPSARAHALISLGVAERERGNVDAAIAYLEAGTALEHELNETVALCEDRCELAIALLRAGRHAQAAALADGILAAADDTGHGFGQPQRLLWTVAAVRHAQGERDQARALIERARRALEKLEAGISDAESRRTFRRLRPNRVIDDAFEHDTWLI